MKPAGDTVREDGNTTVVEFVQFLYIQLAEMPSLTHLCFILLGQHSRTSIFTEKIPAPIEN